MFFFFKFCHFTFSIRRENEGQSFVFQFHSETSEKHMASQTAFFVFFSSFCIFLTLQDTDSGPLVQGTIVPLKSAMGEVIQDGMADGTLGAALLQALLYSKH